MTGDRGVQPRLAGQYWSYHSSGKNPDARENVSEDGNGQGGDDHRQQTGEPRKQQAAQDQVTHRQREEGDQQKLAGGSLLLEGDVAVTKEGEPERDGKSQRGNQVLRDGGPGMKQCDGGAKVDEGSPPADKTETYQPPEFLAGEP